MVVLFLCWTFATAAPTSEDQSALLSAGQNLLAALPKVEAEERLYFEIQMGPNTAVGFSQITLRPEKREGETIYEYASDAVISAGTGPRIAIAMRGTLTRDFQPTHAAVWRENVGRDGEKRATVHRAEFGKDKVTVRVDDGKATASVEVPTPQPPFVFGIEALVAQMTPGKHERFAVREFSVPTGGAEVLVFTPEKWKDGSDTLVARYPDDSGAYQFWFDAEGDLLRWMHMAMPMLFVRSTADRIEELKKKLGPPLVVPTGPTESDKHE